MTTDKRLHFEKWPSQTSWFLTISFLDKIFTYFFLPFLPPEGVPFGMASACSITDLAALLMCLNLSGPRWIPPYHRLTTTMWLEQSKMSSRWERRPPAWASPSSSQSWAICPFVVRILRVEKDLKNFTFIHSFLYIRRSDFGLRLKVVKIFGIWGSNLLKSS